MRSDGLKRRSTGIQIVSYSYTASISSLWHPHPRSISLSTIVIRLSIKDLNIKFLTCAANVFIASIERLENLLVPSLSIPFHRDVDFVDRGNILSQIAEKYSEELSRVALARISGVE